MRLSGTLAYLLLLFGIFYQYTDANVVFPDQLDEVTDGKEGNNKNDELKNLQESYVLGKLWTHYNGYENFYDGNSRPRRTHGLFHGFPQNLPFVMGYPGGSSSAASSASSSSAGGSSSASSAASSAGGISASSSASASSGFGFHQIGSGSSASSASASASGIPQWLLSRNVNSQTDMETGIVFAI